MSTENSNSTHEKSKTNLDNAEENQRGTPFPYYRI